MRKTIKIHVEKPKPSTDNGKDWAIIRALEKYAKKVPQHNLTDVTYTEVKRNTKLVIAILPSWGVYQPPFGLAKLSAVTRAAGYNTTIFDINVDAWHHLKDKTEHDLWDQGKEWMWHDRQHYLTTIHPLLETLFDEYIEKIVSTKPDVVGFSIFFTNEFSTALFIMKLKKQLPDVKIVIGGPQVNALDMLNELLFKVSDYIIQGDGEQNLLNLLENIENNTTVTEKIIKSMDRLNLDNLPASDYSQFDFNSYKVPNAINIEFTRGCVAKCVFCSETNYWKYRGRQSLSVLNEVQYLYETYGTDLIWFTDSLVNGNINELRAFALGVAELKLPIKWTGQARCDRRMDADYFIDLANSGCSQLAIGSESGSQKVLDLIKKSIKVIDIEHNFKNASDAGILIASNWLMGFPGEEIQDVAKTFMLIGRVAPYQLNGAYNTNVSALMITPGTELEQNKERFNVSPQSYEGEWATFDMSNTKLHRLIREKTLIIFLNEISKRTGSQVFTADAGAIAKSCQIHYHDNVENYNASYEDIDFEIIKPNINRFADTAVNEIWPFFWSLWKFFGAYNISIEFDSTEDSKIFGPISCKYDSIYNFSIDKQGYWTADFDFRYDQKIKSPVDYSFNYSWKSTGYWS